MGMGVFGVREEEIGRGKRRTNGVVLAEAEAEAVGLVEVEGVGVEDLDVHLPLFEVVG